MVGFNVLRLSAHMQTKQSSRRETVVSVGCSQQEAMMAGFSRLLRPTSLLGLENKCLTRILKTVPQILKRLNKDLFHLSWQNKQAAKGSQAMVHCHFIWIRQIPITDLGQRLLFMPWQHNIQPQKPVIKAQHVVTEEIKGKWCVSTRLLQCRWLRGNVISELLCLIC